MSLTSAMQVGFTGIDANAVAIDTVGNNLANLNTTAFKKERTLFETMLYRTFGEGSAPNAANGGTLPWQVGLGATVSSLQRDFAQGGLERTGFQNDLAIDGDGFFVVRNADGALAYTRDGSFRLDETQTMVAAGGAPLQVFAVRADGTIDQSLLTDLRIPLGAASAAIPTTAVEMDGRLDSNTSVASSGAVVVSQALMTTDGHADTSTSLTSLVDGNGLPLFANGDELTMQSVKGGIAGEEVSFIVGATGTTLGDLASHLEAALGIYGDLSANGSAGVRISDGTEYPAGSLVIESNPGEINAVGVNGGLVVTRSSGLPTTELSFTTVAEAAGGGVTTTFGVLDSLGNQVDVRLRAVMESQSASGSTWRFYAESAGDSDVSPLLGTGTITFDANGRFVGATGTNLRIDRSNAGAAPVALSMDFSSLEGLAGGNGESALIMATQNGAPPGILTDYSIDQDGIVTGAYSNQSTRVLGQVALATFRNNEGLVASGESRFVEGPDAGAIGIVAPRSGRAGEVVSGGLEQSNVAIAREFVNLISASTGISSASRVVRVADDLLQELLLLAR